MSGGCKAENNLLIAEMFKMSTVEVFLASLLLIYKKNK